MRVLVTRSRPDAERTAERLSRQGHETVIAPLTTIVGTGEPPPSGSYDGTVLTSAHAVPFVSEPGSREGPIFAVGRRTAEAARAAGYRTVHAADGDALALVALIERSLPAGSVLLHVAGRHRKAEPEASLRRAGFSVAVWEAYEARAVRQLPDNLPPLLEAGRIDAVLHYSRRSAAILVDLCDRTGLRPSLQALTHVCLSEDVAAALAILTANPVVAARPDEEALLAALDGAPSRRGSPPPVP
jgi:uroporphyrinogen-III synthase